MIRRGLLIAAGVFALLAVCAPGTRAESRRHTYLVLPFEDGAADPSRGWMREAMALSLGEYFQCAGEKTVSRDDRLLAMEELSLPAGAPLTLATSIKLGRQLATEKEGPSADRLVVGRFTLDQGQISLSARVVNLQSNRAAPWKEEQGSLKDLLQLQRSLARTLLKSDGVSSGDLVAASDEAGAGHAFPLVAYESYVRGLIEPSPGRQISLLRKALDQSPGYPKACFHLGRMLARGGKAREAAAVLKESSAEPVPYAAEYHALLGILALDDGRLSDAESEARKSFSLSDTAEVRILRAKIARANNRPEEARAELERAAAMDPENPDVEALRRQLASPAVQRP
jgi:tetratricopeptide (TPR) repeat protein